MLRIQWVHCEFDGRGWEILCPCVGAVLTDGADRSQCTSLLT